VEPDLGSLGFPHEVFKYPDSHCERTWVGQKSNKVSQVPGLFWNFFGNDFYI